MSNWWAILYRWEWRDTMEKRLIQTPIAVAKNSAAILAALTVLGGVPAFAVDVQGSTSGVFANPTPTTATTTGVGTNAFTFGAGSGSPPNSLTFNGASFSSAFETPFKIGTISYFNGATVAGTEATAVDLVLATNFSTPTLPTVSNSFTLSFVFTPNSGTADENADFLFFPNSFGTNVFDIDGTTYRVKLVGFENIIGDGFLTSDSTQLHVREGSLATADVYAEVTSEVPAVPEPSSWAMMMLGFAGIGIMTYRRRKSAMLAA
jgi:hypothetical protein